LGDRGIIEATEIDGLLVAHHDALVIAPVVGLTENIAGGAFDTTCGGALTSAPVVCGCASTLLDARIPA